MADKKEPEIYKIVLTGGPCAGKTKTLTILEQELANRGIKTLTVPESMTMLRNAGCTPDTVPDPVLYDTIKLSLQLALEKEFEDTAKNMNYNSIVLFYDRGIPDARGFLTDKQYHQVLVNKDLNEQTAMDRYDAVIHLTTTAKGMEDAYTTENNGARLEDLDGARIVDDRLVETWTGHPHLRIIENFEDFRKKQDKVLKEVCNVIGYPEPLECERKFVIEYPDIQKLLNKPNCQKVNITQTYLKTAGDGIQKRLRCREINGNCTYYETTKKPINKTTRVEVENKLSEHEYFDRMNDADPDKNQIHKTRYCITENNQYFEVDVYPFWQDRAIMEIELSDENEKIHPPEDIDIIADVTGDERYTNYSLASNTDIPLDKMKEKLNFRMNEQVEFKNTNKKDKDINNDKTR